MRIWMKLGILTYSVHENKMGMHAVVAYGGGGGGGGMHDVVYPGQRPSMLADHSTNSRILLIEQR